MCPSLYWARSTVSLAMTMSVPSTSILPSSAFSAEEDAPLCLHPLFLGIFSDQMSFLPGDFHICLSSSALLLSLYLDVQGFPLTPSVQNTALPSTYNPSSLCLRACRHPFWPCSSFSTYPSPRFQFSQHSRCLACSLEIPVNLVDGDTEQSPNSAALEAQDSEDVLRMTGERGKKPLDMLLW